MFESALCSLGKQKANVVANMSSKDHAFHARVKRCSGLVGSTRDTIPKFLRRKAPPLVAHTSPQQATAKSTSKKALMNILPHRVPTCSDVCGTFPWPCRVLSENSIVDAHDLQGLRATTSDSDLCNVGSWVDTA